MPAEATAILTVEELTTAEGLAALRGEWSALWDRCPGATPFQSPGWLLPWWRAFGCGTLHALAIRRDATLIGLFPLYLPEGLSQEVPTLWPVGIGNTDRLDPLLDPPWAREALRAALDYLADGGPWQACDFQNVSPGSPLLAESADGWLAEPSAQDVCPVLDLRDGGASIPEGRRRRVRYERRRLGRLGSLEAERACGDNLDELLDDLFRLHGDRWARRGGEGVLADRLVRYFLAEAARELLKSGSLRLDALRLDGRIVAACLGLAMHGRWCYYIGGFDPDLARYSPGLVAVGHAIESAIAEGAEAFDFLRGAEPYKYEWGAVDERLGRLLLRRCDGGRESGAQ